MVAHLWRKATRRNRNDDHNKSTHNDKILSTHYCGARNRPVAELKSNKNGRIKFVTNQKRSGLDVNKESFVGSWEFVIMPNEKDEFTYKYTSIGPYSFEAEAKMNRVK